jgi:hypothetical protein
MSGAVKVLESAGMKIRIAQRRLSPLKVVADFGVLEDSLACGCALERKAPPQTRGAFLREVLAYR